MILRNARSRVPTASLVLLALAGLCPLATAAEPDRVSNRSEARDGVRVVRMEELWRVDDQDEEFFLGAVGQVLSDDDGTLYVLDRQQSQVVVLSRDGDFLRTLSREGEGPGEVRRPRDMLFMADGSIGITQLFPGKIIKVTKSGDPAGEIALGSDDQDLGGLYTLFNARSRGGTLVVVGDEMGSDPNRVNRTRFLAAISPEGAETARLLTDRFSQSAADFVWDEERDYFVHFGGLALGPDGLVYAAPERDRYRVHVYRPDGSLVRVIEREFVPRKRTPEEIDVIHDTRRMIRNGVEVPKRIGDYAPSISRLWVDRTDHLWVLHSRSGTDQPEGILQTYDVFDPQGVLVRQLSIACPGDPDEDVLFPLGDGRAVLVKGFTSAALALIGARGNRHGEEEVDDAAPLELIVYEMKL